MMMTLMMCAMTLAIPPAATADDGRPDVVFADFEGETYGDWKAAGTAFGDGPARGTQPGQMRVSGFRGDGLVNTFRGGDRATGTLTSPEFRIDRNHVAFLIGGGGFPGKTCLNLLIDGKVARTATGPNTEPGGDEGLEPGAWDVAEFAGRTARLQIVDDATGGWGHINVDHIVFTDARPQVASDAAREVVLSGRFLHFPVKTGGPKRKVTVAVDGRVERSFDIELADAGADWWAPLDVSAWKGKAATIRAGKLPAGSTGLASIDQGDDLKGAEDLYREPLRPLIHFSARRGWLNDPNGLVFADGVYHLFFQHNPYGWAWGNMHWGHAVSTDLVHWEERGEALYPDAMGTMFSGSAVVDRANTSGLGRDGKPPLVLLYTAAGNPTVQGLASSTDGGRTFAKFAGNPVVGQITDGNRDPKVIWHAPTGRWVMALYVGLPGPPKDGKATTDHTIHFLASPDLKHWEVTGKVSGYFECPDLFELPVDGDPARARWVLTAASGEYSVGTFDSRTFKPETPKLPGHHGRGFYAAQTFSDIPDSDGRRIQVGWLQAPSPGMPFNQAMSVPHELKLAGTPDGPRLVRAPVKELETLREAGVSAGPATLEPGGPNPLASAKGDALDIVATFEPGSAREVIFTVRGVPVAYDAAKGELVVNGVRAPAPPRDGRVDLRILADRTAFEVFAAGGLAYVPLPVIPKAEDTSVVVSAVGGPVEFAELTAYPLRSAWEPGR
ncbi:glycoside hydrolase family 32 protein [Tundrisphaera sp. TA3]|uniref:glycoside hydrolase family 32 protein n=1 Tax=Tundrisphaera sp. TA3 TaxID=3435775 RepID=UPI003EBF7A74